MYGERDEAIDEGDEDAMIDEALEDAAAGRLGELPALVLAGARTGRAWQPTLGPER